MILRSFNILRKKALYFYISFSEYLRNNLTFQIRENIKNWRIWLSFIYTITMMCKSFTTYSINVFHYFFLSIYVLMEISGKIKFCLLWMFVEIFDGPLSVHIYASAMYNLLLWLIIWPSTCNEFLSTRCIGDSTRIKACSLTYYIFIYI